MRTLLIKAFRGQLLVEVLIRARGLIILPIATRALGPSGYGLIAFAGALTGLVGTVATLGMPAAISRFLPGKESDRERAAIFWPGFAACAVSTCVFASLTVTLFSWTALAPEEVPLILIALAAANVVSNELKLYAYGFWRYSLELGPYYRFLKADVALVGIAQIFVLLPLHGGPVALLIASITADGVLFATALALLARRLPWRAPSLAVLAPLYRYGFPLIAAALLNWANNTIDRFFIQAYDGNSAVGVYSVGYNLGFLAVGLFATPLFAIFPSVLFRTWDQGRRAEAARLLQGASLLLLLATLPGILSLAFFGRPFVTLMAGEEFAEAHRYVALIATGYLLMFLGDFYGYPLWLHNRQYLYSVSLALSVGVNVVGNILLVPRYGALGSAIATTASLGILAAALAILNISFGYMRPPFAKPVGVTLIAVACWSAASLLWPKSPTIGDTALFSAASTVAFLVTAFGFGLFPRELQLESLLRRRKLTPDASEPET